MDRRTLYGLLRGLAKRAGIGKRSNPHWFRHSRISIAFVNREADLATISVWFWGMPVTPMANRYSHFAGLDSRIAPAAAVDDLKPVPALPVPPMLATQRQVGELADEVRRLRFGFQVMVSRWAADHGVAPGAELTVHIDEATGEVSIKPVPRPAGSMDEPQT
jgi:hypothetical protein